MLLWVRVAEVMSIVVRQHLAAVVVDTHIRPAPALHHPLYPRLFAQVPVLAGSAVRRVAEDSPAAAAVQVVVPQVEVAEVADVEMMCDVRCKMYNVDS